MQGAQVLSVVEEVRPHMSHGGPEKNYGTLTYHPHDLPKKSTPKTTIKSLGSQATTFSQPPGS